MADTGRMRRVHEGNTLGGAMNTLFCTPEQGARLKELLPKLESVFMWASLSDDKWFIIEQRSITDGAFVEFRPTFVHALTLQELRDVAQREFTGEIVADPVFANAFETWVYTSSAPDFAEWLIARLEEGR
jgi:hypothetical protein